MLDPLKRIPILLVICIFLIFLIATPAFAESDRAAGQSSTSAESNSGKGMNRQGGPSTHPGKGWKDPGSWQGSPKNTADPDCTGNRTSNPQSTNIGACDDSAGAADKPGGSGGFDSDKDWNNGCGNDTDFEDDNNGLCGGRKAAPKGGEVSKPPKSPIRGGQVSKPPGASVGEGEDVPNPSPPLVQPGGESGPVPPPQVVRQPSAVTPPVTVLSGEIRRSAPIPAGRQVPARTGLAAMDLLLIGISSVALGMRMLHRGRYLSR
ncbi:MAG: hypothetical protein KY429_00805 [Actinobacteria bacterium]|nr:hypothetical protein [Actinomycetota bacterium]